MAVRDDYSTPTNDDALTKFATEHLGLLVSFVGVVIFALRCVVVSKNDPSTALALIAQTSLGDTIRAILLSASGILCYVVAVVLAWIAGARAAASARYARRALLGPRVLPLLLISGASMSVFVYYGGGFSGGLLGGLVFVYGLVGTVVIMSLVDHVSLRAGLSSKSDWWGRRLNYAFVLLVLIYAIGVSIGTSRFWLPSEEFTFKESMPFTGYLLKGSEDYLIIFEERRRIVIEKPKADLVSRQFCYLPTRFPVGNASKHLPRCP